MPTASLGIQMKNWGFGFYGITEAAGYAVIDPDRLEIIIEHEGLYWKYDEIANTLRETSWDEYVMSSFEYALNEKLTYLQLRGLAYAEIPLYVQDILSSLYYLRTLDLEVGKTEEVESYADGKVYTLKIVVHKR